MPAQGSDYNNYCVAAPDWLEFGCSHNPCGNCSAGFVLLEGLQMFPGILVPIVLFFGFAVVGAIVMSSVER